MDNTRRLPILVRTNGFHVTCYPSVNLHHQSVRTTGVILSYNSCNSVKPCRDPGTWSPASHRRSSNQFQAGSHVICGGRSVNRTGVSQNTSAFPCHYHFTNALYSFAFTEDYRVISEYLTRSLLIAQPDI
jgi:hypothetical protein